MDAATREVFDAFARARMPALLRFAHALTGSPAAAEDLVQDALERTGLAWNRIARQDDPEAYVRRVMVNAHVSRWRRLRRERLVAALPDVRPAAEPAARDAAMWNLLASLPPKQRAVLVLRYYEDLPEQRIAAVLGCSPGTVKSQASKALAKLRAALEEQRETTWTS